MPVTRWLSAEWFDELRSECHEPLVPGLSGRLQCEISGGPQRVLAGYWVLDDGRMVDGGPGLTDDPDVTMTIGWDDALAVQRGDLDPNVAFMQGRLKVAGAMGVLLALLPAARDEVVRDRLRRIAARTEF